MKCYIVKDLLPGYIDGLTSGEVSAEIKEHLEGCKECRRFYKQMSAAVPSEPARAERKIDFFKRFKSRMRRKNAVTALIACAVLAVPVIFLKTFTIPIPYEPEYHSVEIEHNVAIPEPPYTTLWRDADLFDFETSRKILAGEYDFCEWRDFVKLHYSGYNNAQAHIQKYGRSIVRNGERVDIVYYCAQRELWDVLFSGESQSDRRGGFWIMGNLNDDRVYHAGYTPRMTEIYYLPMRNTKRLEQLSDEEFDAERENAVLVFSGVI